MSDRETRDENENPVQIDLINLDQTLEKRTPGGSLSAYLNTIIWEMVSRQQSDSNA